MWCIKTMWRKTLSSNYKMAKMNLVKWMKSMNMRSLLINGTLSLQRRNQSLNLKVLRISQGNLTNATLTNWKDFLLTIKSHQASIKQYSWSWMNWTDYKMKSRKTETFLSSKTKKIPYVRNSNRDKGPIHFRRRMIIY